MITAPMTASSIEDIKDLKYPLYVSPKLDGIRCLILEGKPLSRTLKPIPNRYIRSLLKTLPDGLDGEIITLNNEGMFDTFNDIQSKVMSQDGEPPFTYFIFDYLPNLQTRVPFHIRYSHLMELRLTFFCTKLEQLAVRFPEELTRIEEQFLRVGYEGAMVRSVDAPYKCGRSTLKEGYLLKLKRFEDGEARIISVEELVQEHTSAPTGLMGALVCIDLKTGVEFKIGTGFTEQQRRDRWRISEVITYKYQKHGMKDKPRIPVFKGIRKD